MQKSMSFSLVILLVLFTGSISYAQETGRAFFDFGVFSYEDGDYTDAEGNFKKALESNPDNPLYYQYLGKTYLKMARFEEALTHFTTAHGIDAEMPGLDEDLAALHYKMSNYEQAAALFIDIAREEPSNVMAFYHAGISLMKLERYGKALDYFLDASEKSPTIKTNGYYYAGICYQKTGKTDKAVEVLTYVKSHATSESLKASADKWLEAIAKEKKARKPYSLYLKIGGQYDDNVRLEPLDRDLYADEDDAAVIGHFMGSYNIVNRKDITIGAGYSHYQAYYIDLSEFDLVGSTGTLFAKYRLQPFIFSLSYLPSYYWVDYDSYLRQHQVRPEITYQFSKSFLGKFAYTYSDKEFFEGEDRDGYAHEGYLDLYYALKKNLRIFGGAGYELNDARHDDEDYGEYKTKLGCTLKAPWRFDITLTGKYKARRYANEDSLLGDTREDDQYSGTLSASRPVYFEWLKAVLEYHYTKNFSNIDDFEYDRNLVTLSLIVRY
jgi:tetratricopeptide (TPR) repeat protein